jgi:UDP-N-acetylglucosamine acyltransferase
MIDKSAIIHKTANIGKNVKVGAYTVIGENVTVGDDVTIGAHVVIERDTAIGQGCNIYNFVSVGTDPQDIKYKGEKTELKIGKNNTIREFSTLNRGTANGGGITRIGDNNFFMAYSHVAHDCDVGNNIVMANVATLGGHVTVEDFVIIGGLSAIHQFSRVGKYSFIGGASAVTRDVPPFMSAVGNRAELHGFNLVGLKRHNISTESISNLKKAYSIIFRSKKALKTALKEVTDTMSDCSEVIYLVNFLKNSQRGFIRACKKKTSQL